MKSISPFLKKYGYLIFKYAVYLALLISAAGTCIHVIICAIAGARVQNTATTSDTMQTDTNNARQLRGYSTGESTTCPQLVEAGSSWTPSRRSRCCRAYHRHSHHHHRRRHEPAPPIMEAAGRHARRGSEVGQTTSSRYAGSGVACLWIRNYVPEGIGA